MNLGETGVIRAVHKRRFSVYPNQSMAWFNTMTFDSWSTHEHLHTATVKLLATQLKKLAPRVSALDSRRHPI